MADGSATLSRRDYEFQEPTLRPEHAVKRENLSGESQGDREDFQPEATKDDAETQNDMWSTLEDFIYLVLWTNESSTLHLVQVSNEFDVVLLLVSEYL